MALSLTKKRKIHQTKHILHHLLKSKWIFIKNVKKMTFSSVTLLITYSPFFKPENSGGQRQQEEVLLAARPPKKVEERHTSAPSGHHIAPHWPSVREHRLRVVSPGWRTRTPRGPPLTNPAESIFRPMLWLLGLSCVRKSQWQFSARQLNSLWSWCCGSSPRTNFIPKSCKNFIWLCATAGGVVMGKNN